MPLETIVDSALGPLAALGSSTAWAYASSRYSRLSRRVGPARVNFARATVAFTVFAACAFVFQGKGALAGITASGSAWLLVSALSSYALADSIFFEAARSIGVTTALSIASVYPLWAALFGAVALGERLGVVRALGMGLSVGGIVLLVRISRGDSSLEPRFSSRTRGVALAAVTSVLWAANGIAVKRGAVGLSLYQANAVRYGVAFVVLAPQARWSAEPRAPVRDYYSIFPAILADAVFGSLCFVYGFAHTELAVGATLTSLAPLISLPFAVILGEEAWSLPRLFAVVTTVSGVVMLVSGGAN